MSSSIRAKYIEEISKLYIKNNWTLSDLIKFMAWAGIKEKYIRDYIIAGVTLKTAMLKAYEGGN
ncbi:MAG: hypothetical protein LBD63_02770 [Mycoplasmataceae bacterium]|jgi:hypothetical protein|nr:hypothetical protein [Mycoplasmataceae bacterium]